MFHFLVLMTKPLIFRKGYIRVVPDVSPPLNQTSIETKVNSFVENAINLKSVSNQTSDLISDPKKVLIEYSNQVIDKIMRKPSNETIEDIETCVQLSETAKTEWYVFLFDNAVNILKNHWFLIGSALLLIIIAKIYYNLSQKLKNFEIPVQYMSQNDQKPQSVDEELQLSEMCETVWSRAPFDIHEHRDQMRKAFLKTKWGQLYKTSSVKAEEGVDDHKEGIENVCENKVSGKPFGKSDEISENNIGRDVSGREPVILNNNKSFDGLLEDTSESDEKNYSPFVQKCFEVFEENPTNDTNKGSNPRSDDCETNELSSIKRCDHCRRHLDIPFLCRHCQRQRGSDGADKWFQRANKAYSMGVIAMTAFIVFKSLK